MENQQLINGLQWLGGGLIALLATIGIGSLLLAVINRYWSKRDKSSELQETNQGKQIDSDDKFRDTLIKRVELLETNLKLLQDEFNSQMKENARLSAENVWLKKDNERLEAEISELRTQRRASDKTIAELRAELNALKLRFDGTSPLPVQLVDQPLEVEDKGNNKEKK